MTYQLIPGYLLVELINTDVEQITDTGIVVSHPVNPNNPPRAKIIAQNLIPDQTGVNVGDQIMYKPGCGWEYVADDANYRFIRYDDILTVYTDKDAVQSWN